MLWKKMIKTKKKKKKKKNEKNSVQDYPVTETHGVNRQILMPD